jgi:hypothetical protein
MSNGENERKHIDELINALEATTQLITSLVDDMQENSELVVLLKEKVQLIESQIVIMETILRGDGVSESLITRFALLEKDVEAVLEKIKKIEESDKEQNLRHTKMLTERMKILLGGFITLLASIASAILGYYLK